ncbi:hypothetical protein CDAR_611761 [Caerostris darwini]|uniref:Uncharacterized protein n=1 Tax=Caerostris darwini TaxID=1538125 RepID=A0AAV4MU09_9ARAC|nr:hypothetical protein CDAR_611761 [Caerostris darwini]
MVRTVPPQLERSSIQLYRETHISERGFTSAVACQSITQFLKANTPTHDGATPPNYSEQGVLPTLLRHLRVIVTSLKPRIKQNGIRYFRRTDLLGL